VTQSEEWSRRFAELSAEAGRVYGRSLRRYNELLARVASGELKPDHVQSEFREYVQEHSTTSTRELVESSVGLLAGLLYVEAMHREALLDGLLPPDAPIPPPPEPSTVDVTNWFQALSKYAAEQNARGIARHQRLVERIGAGEITAKQVQDHGRRYLEAQAPQFIDEVVKLGMTFASRMQQSSTNLADGLYDRLLGPDPESSPPRTAPLVVDLRGATGSVVTAEIVVENTRAEAAAVACHLSEFISREHAAVPAGDVAPSRFTLSPGESRDVVVSVPLDRGLFAPNVDYFGLLRVAGAGESEMVVQLIAHAE
jgi:hypothetical protein